MQKMLYTIEELAESTGITPRTIRYYTTEGLMPTPETRGRYALYTDAHLQRLQLIVQLKAAYLPLNTIKAKLEQVSNQNVSQLLQGEELAEGEEPAAPASEENAAPTGDESPAEYIARVLSNRKTLSSRASPRRTPGSYPSLSKKASADADASQDAPGEAWRHIELLSGVEMVVRVPVSEKNRANVEKMIAYAQSVRDGKE